MIEIQEACDYEFEDGVAFPVYLPDCSHLSDGSVLTEIAGWVLGEFFEDEETYTFENSKVRIVPELPLNHVIGIPSLEGKIFEED